MTADSLGGRIAKTVWESHRDRQLAQLGMKPSEHAADIPIPDWAYAIADSVIKELGLRRANMGEWDVLACGFRGYRYVTDWVDPDE